jgi:hypothetical protein
MAKPSDFYVGVVDIFSILLPGAVVTWSGWLWIRDEVELSDRLPEGEIALWVAFVLVAYAAGHFVFLLASWVDRTFNLFRTRILRKCMTQFDRDIEKAAFAAVTALRRVSLAAWPEADRDFLTDDTEMWARNVLKKPGTGPIIAEPSNSFQWSRAVLRIRAPAALAEVLRHEADSKFFRSLFVVFILLAACSLARLPGSDRLPLPFWFTLLLAVLSYWRYAERRLKCIEEAYLAVIVYFTLGGGAAATKTGDE